MKNNISKSSHWGSSLKSLPWKNKATLSAYEKMISTTVKEWYEEKHRVSSKEELELINSQKIV